MLEPIGLNLHQSNHFCIFAVVSFTRPCDKHRPWYLACVILIVWFAARDSWQSSQQAGAAWPSKWDISQLFVFKLPGLYHFTWVDFHCTCIYTWI